MFAPVFLGGTFVIIILLEFFTWRLFRRRIEGLLFPRSVDASFFRFFSLTRIRVCAVVHAVFLLTGVSLLFFLLW